VSSALLSSLSRWTSANRATAATAKSSANRKVDGTETPKRRGGRRAPIKVYAKPRR
jgi:hypothetical protein